MLSFKQPVRELPISTERDVLAAIIANPLDGLPIFELLPAAALPQPRSALLQGM
jgi:hypothetical protein